MPAERYTVKERLTLLGILPKEGNAVSMRVLREFAEALSLPKEEWPTVGLTQDPDNPGNLTWDVAKDGDGKEIDTCATMREIIVTTLRELDDKKKLTMDLLPLYERFVASV